MTTDVSSPTAHNAGIPSPLTAVEPTFSPTASPKSTPLEDVTEDLPPFPERTENPSDKTDFPTTVEKSIGLPPITVPEPTTKVEETAVLNLPSTEPEENTGLNSDLPSTTPTMEESIGLPPITVPEPSPTAEETAYSNLPSTEPEENAGPNPNPPSTTTTVEKSIGLPPTITEPTTRKSISLPPINVPEPTPTAKETAYSNLPTTEPEENTGLDPNLPSPTPTVEKSVELPPITVPEPTTKSKEIADSHLPSNEPEENAGPNQNLPSTTPTVEKSVELPPITVSEPTTKSKENADSDLPSTEPEENAGPNQNLPSTTPALDKSIGLPPITVPDKTTATPAPQASGGGVGGLMALVAVLVAVLAAAFFYVPQSATSQEVIDVGSEVWLANLLGSANDTMWHLYGGSGGLMLSMVTVTTAVSNVEKGMVQLQLGEIKAEYQEYIQGFMKELSMLVAAYKGFHEWAEDVMVTERSILDLLAEKLPPLYGAMQIQNEDLCKYLVELLTDRLDNLEVQVKKLVTIHKEIEDRTAVLKIKVDVFRKARESSANAHQQSMIDNFVGSVAVTGATGAALAVINFSPLAVAGAATVPLVNSILAVVGLSTMEDTIAGRGALSVIYQSIEAFKQRLDFKGEKLTEDSIANFDNGMREILDEMKRRTLTLKNLRQAVWQTKDGVVRTSTTTNMELLRVQVDEIVESAQKLSKAYAGILGLSPLKTGPATGELAGAKE